MTAPSELEQRLYETLRNLIGLAKLRGPERLHEYKALITEGEELIEKYEATHVRA